MNKLFSKIAAASVGLAMAVGVGVAVSHKAGVVRADDESVDFTAQGYENQQAIESYNGTDFDIAFSKGTNSNAPKYYTSGTAIRCYGGNTLTFTAKSGKAITEVSFTFGSSDGSNAITADIGTFASPTWTGSSDTVVFTIGGTSGNRRFAGVSVTTVAQSGPTVTIENKPTSNLEIGDSGTLIASSTGATSPSYTWSSSNSDVVSITPAGAYEAVGFGTCEITVNLTATEGNASKSCSVSVNSGKISVADAVNIAKAFDPSQSTSTDYLVVVEGYIVSLEESVKDSKPRAIKLSDEKIGGETEDNSIIVYGIYSDAAFRSYAILNGKATFKMNVQNFKGTYELSGTVVVVDYIDDAITFAHDSYNSLNAACAVGPASVTDDQWNDLATAFAALDEYAQAKLAAATSEDKNEDIAHWVDRYTRIVVSGKSNFMNNTSAAAIALENETLGNSSNTIIIIIAATFAITAFGAVLLIRKKRHSK